jgi:DNA-directed RNA polymerase alpha subunit
MTKVSNDINTNRMKEAKLFSVQSEKFLKLCQTHKVFVDTQNELPEEPPFVLYFEDTDFWVGCYHSEKEAKAVAKNLGLVVLK